MNSSNFYNWFSPYYKVIDFFLDRYKSKLIEVVNSFESGKLLEVGIGHGAYVKKYTKHSITGLDSSAKMLKKAAQNLPPKVELIHNEILKVPLKKKTFNLVILAHVLSTCSDPNRVIQQCTSLLKNGGRLIVLNHFTSSNFMGFIDYLMNPLASVFHFSLYFKKDKLSALNKLELEKEYRLPPLKSYRLLVYKKNT